MPAGKFRGVELTDPVPLKDRVATLEKTVQELKARFDAKVPVVETENKGTE